MPKVLLWVVISSKKQEHFPATRTLLMHLRSTETVSKIQLESAFRRLFHRLNELSMINQNAYIILVDFGEYCVARNLMDEEFLNQLKKQTEFAKDPQRIERLKKHICEIIAEFFSSGDIDEAIRCISEMDTPFYNHEVVKRIISIAFDKGNRERELTSLFLAKSVGDGDNCDYPIPRKNCELGFIILLQRVEGLYKDVPDILELLSSFIGRAIIDEVLPPNFINNVDLLQTDMGYAVINHVKHLLSGPRHSDQLLNVWGANNSKSIESMKKAIKNIIREYLISRELDEALTAIQELNIPMFHHEIIKQLIPAVADYYVAKDLQINQQNNNNNNNETKIDYKKLNIPKEINDKAIQIQLAIDLISTALQHNIMAIEQINGGFKRLRERMDDYKLDSPLITKYYQCIFDQFKDIINEQQEEEEKKESDNNNNNNNNNSTFIGGAKNREIDDEIKQITNDTKNLVIEYASKNNKNIKFNKYDVIECKTQIVAGINIFLKICINNDNYIHVFIWKKFDKTMEILNVDFDKKKSDPLQFNKQKKIKKLGGLKDRDIDQLVIKSCKTIKNDVITKAKNDKQDSNFKEFIPIKAKCQVVAGTNLFIKVKINTNKYIHIRIWCKLDSTIELSNVEWNKTENDEIVYF